MMKMNHHAIGAEETLHKMPALVQVNPRIGAQQRACRKQECQAARRKKTQAGWRATIPITSSPDEYMREALLSQGQCLCECQGELTRARRKSHGSIATYLDELSQRGPFASSSLQPTNINRERSKSATPSDTNKQLIRSKNPA
jgi:hypothetical protein